MNGLSFIGFSSKHIVLMNDFQRKLKSGTEMTETMRSWITPSADPFLNNGNLRV